MSEDASKSGSGQTESAPEFKMYIGGEWVQSVGGDSFTAQNPATDDTIATIPAGTREDARNAIKTAQDAQKELKSLSNFERAELLYEMADAVEDNFDELGEWLSRDLGRPLDSSSLINADTEIEMAAERFRIVAEDIKRDETTVHPSQDPNKRIHTIHEPHGVYAIITPWNYPVAIPGSYHATALGVGNSIVWVPAPTTSAVAVKFMEVLEETSLPDGALNLVTGEGRIVGNEIVVNSGTDAVAFTGSPETGEKIARDAGTKPTVLELGGNGANILLEDGDVEAAVDRSVFGCFVNTGQDCAGTERVLVHESVHDEFVSQLADRVENLVVGDPFEEDTDIGPLNNENVAEKVTSHVKDAIDKGATVVVGGDQDLDSGDLFFDPMIFIDVTEEMLISQSETFGPIAPVMSFSHHDEAIEIANKSGTGLITGVFTSNIAAMYEFAERIETGNVNINEGSCYSESYAPFGGYSGKKSGHGRLGGRYSIDEMSQVKTITVDIDNAGRLGSE